MDIESSRKSQSRRLFSFDGRVYAAFSPKKSRDKPLPDVPQRTSSTS
jgi:hypothetical protein